LREFSRHESLVFYQKAAIARRGSAIYPGNYSRWACPASVRTAIWSLIDSDGCKDDETARTADLCQLLIIIAVGRQ
jgi:hypothetical protein